MRRDVKLLSGKDLFKADVNMLNGFVDKCAPIWGPVFKNEFEREGFNLQEYAKEMDDIMMNLRYIATTKKMEGYNLAEELNDFIEKEDLSKYQSEDILKGCMYLMCTQQLIMESVLNKDITDNLYNEMYMYNMIKGFIHSLKEFEIKNELDLSFIEIPKTLKLTIESLLTESDKKYVRF